MYYYTNTLERKVVRNHKMLTYNVQKSFVKYIDKFDETICEFYEIIIQVLSGTYVSKSFTI